MLISGGCWNDGEGRVTWWGWGTGGGGVGMQRMSEVTNFFSFWSEKEQKTKYAWDPLLPGPSYGYTCLSLWDMLLTSFPFGDCSLICQNPINMSLYQSSYNYGGIVSSVPKALLPLLQTHHSAWLNEYLINTHWINDSGYNYLTISSSKARVIVFLCTVFHSRRWIWPLGTDAMSEDISGCHNRIKSATGT